jgi:hypothetical protein
MSLIASTSLIVAATVKGTPLSAPHTNLEGSTAARRRHGRRVLVTQRLFSAYMDDGGAAASHV